MQLPFFVFFISQQLLQWVKQVFCNFLLFLLAFTLVDRNHLSQIFRTSLNILNKRFLPQIFHLTVTPTPTPPPSPLTKKLLPRLIHLVASQLHSYQLARYLVYWGCLFYCYIYLLEIIYSTLLFNLFYSIMCLLTFFTYLVTLPWKVHFIFN